MWIEDIRKALFSLAMMGISWSDLIERIEDGIIYTSSGKQLAIADLVKAYDNIY